MNDIIYLDYAASTPVDPRVVKKMLTFLSEPATCANPSSLHAYGQLAREAIEAARAQVAAVINASAEEIIWTSGATEAINLALKGAASMQQRKGKHLVTIKTEHKAVLDTCQYLEKHGFVVTYLPVQSNGLVDPEVFAAALREDTIVASVMQVNNEIGVIQNLAELAAITAQRNILLHIDAAQAIGKVPLDVDKIPIDLVSMCAHKVYGPKGIGALYLRKKPRVRVEPLIHGGGHEQGMRSGTLATHQIVGMGEAFALAREHLHEDVRNIVKLRDALIAYLKPIKNFQLNTSLEHSVPHILNVRFDGMIAAALLEQLPIAASTGSACLGQSESHVLRALGLREEQIKASLRLSFGRFTQAEEIQKVGHSLQNLCSN